MKEPSHLSDEQVAGYCNRTLGPAELLDVDGHISVCEICRDRLTSNGRTSARIAELMAEISGHLDYAAVVACAEGSPTPEQSRHLDVCAQCRGDVQDLRDFRVQLQERPHAAAVTPITTKRPAPRWRIPLTAAAAVALAALGTWSLRRPAAPLPPAPGAQSQPAEAPLTASERQALDLAVADRRLPRAPILDRLVSHQGTLLGPGGDTKTFDLTSPLGTVVASDRPVFRWSPLAGAASYVVSIYDQNFEQVATSPALSGTEWQPDRPLPRGGVLNWQVTAKVGGETVHSPVPPAPEARFAVLPADAAAEIDSARREHPGNHLLLAVLYAKSGAVEDAARELDALDPVAAAPYRESLKKSEPRP